MSGFSAVDVSSDPAGLVRFLDLAAQAEWGMKHYAAAAHALRKPQLPILDLGCGAGHDLSVLSSFGMRAVGLDPSAVMLDSARSRAERSGALLVRGVGEQLPFCNGAFAGCRIERVLMHADDPELVLSEVVRCVLPGGLITIFEPDWSGFRVDSCILASEADWLTSIRWPAIAKRLVELLEAGGCQLLDLVEERSVWRSLETLERVCGFPDSVGRAVAAGRLSRQLAEAWVEEQRARERAGAFRAVMPKLLVVACNRP